MTTPTVEPYARIRRSEAVVAQELNEQVILVHLDTNEIYDLGPTAARLWALLAHVPDRHGLVWTLLQEYDVEPARLAADVDRTLALLARHDLVQVESP